MVFQTARDSSLLLVFLGLRFLFATGCVINTFSLCAELRTQTSGAATPQMQFHSWRTLDEDPFWVPTTQEELELLGEKGDAPVYAHQLLIECRKRRLSLSWWGLAC